MALRKRASKQNPKVLCVDGITVYLTKKRVKNINMRMSADGTSVNVSAPSWVRESQIEDFVHSKQNWIIEQQDKLKQSLGQAVKKQTKEEVEGYRRIVMEQTPPLIKHWEEVMGVKSKKLAYSNMTSRWGSCNPQTGRICINIQLARYPRECLEYIVVHELCHLKERGHGPRFKALMDEHLPNWRTRRELLRRDPERSTSESNGNIR